MRTPVPFAQARTFAELVLVNDERDLEIDTLGTEGQAGPLLVDFGTVAMTIDEQGICSLAEEST